MSDKDWNRKDHKAHQENLLSFAVFAPLAVRLTGNKLTRLDLEKTLEKYAVGD
jgi:hypothetical protein